MTTTVDKRLLLPCTCHGTKPLAEYVDNGQGKAIVVRTKRNGEEHTLVIPIDKDGKVCIESTNN
jgi:hypothetical protein